MDGKTMTASLTSREGEASTEPQSLIRDLVRVIVIVSWAFTMTSVCTADDSQMFDALSSDYGSQITPLLKTYCLDCHSAEAKEGEFDLERFANFGDVRHDPAAWQKVAHMFDTGEMPPEDSPQLSEEEHEALTSWVKQYLDAEALANAGDPGPVVLRRLNNAEYTYTIQDLTGLPLEPTREFPTDGAAGEGFTNTGAALSMSPALVSKYLDAAKLIADHAMLLPDGIRFSEGTTRRDRENEYLAEIREIYFRYTGRLGDASVLNHWNVSDPTQVTDEDGRVNLASYLSVLLAHRDRLLEDVTLTDEYALQEGLSPKYLRTLAEMLVSGNSSSVLLDDMRQKWRSATADDAAALAASIGQWQQSLWKFNTVGHFALIRPWQEAVTPLQQEQFISQELPEASSDGTIRLTLVTGAAGDGHASDHVIWRQPRIEREGRPPLLLRDVNGASIVLERLRNESLAAMSRYLSAAHEARTVEKVDADALAEKHNVDAAMLQQWLNYLGIATAGEAQLTELMTHRIQNIGGYAQVNGWGIDGSGDLSLSSNASDDELKIPGDARPHQIVVHPRPDRWVAAGWKSPIAGQVRVKAHVQHAHNACGNGVNWSIELRQGAQRRVLRSGSLDRGGMEDTELISPLRLNAGDVVSLIISARDNNHACDLTEIDLTLTEASGDKGAWSLSGDVADDILTGNPHADRLGNENVWHFYSDHEDGSTPTTAVPPDSLLAQWLDASDTEQASELAEQIASLITQPPAADISMSNAELRLQLTSLNGALFGHLDPAELAKRATDEDVAASPYGVDVERFITTDGEPTADLPVQAPSALEVVLPAEWVAEGTFVTNVTLAPDAEGTASIQAQVMGESPSDIDAVQPGVPVIVRVGSEAERKWTEAFNEFRELFPLAMCYPRIVPVDEVVTLTLLHREDERLCELMLSDDEIAKLDRLWEELHFVSRDKLRIETGFEQLLEFASQDDVPARFEPLREPIEKQAAEFQEELRAAEPHHMRAVLDFASQAWRRPLSGGERSEITQLYDQLREQELSHDEAIHLLFVRVLTSPAFLYKLETPAAGSEPAPVDDWELATRLSYFLWSSLPDDELRQLAESGQLNTDDTLLAQTRRMLNDARIRRLAIEFGCQWLYIREFDEFDEKNEQLYPEFVELRSDMYEESIRVFEDLFRNDRSILSLIDGDHTFLNERLAQHYGIKGVDGDRWRRVSGMRSHGRGSILTQATNLSRQSGASRTSPILRGNWISETLLGERLPRPPANVPLLPESEANNDGLTFRQLTEKHSSDPACMKCHKRIDPMGFTLEEFDAIGRSREQDTNGLPIDTNTTLMDGTPLAGVEGLREYLITVRRDTIVRQFCKKLLGYALGRSVQLSDEPLLTEMMTRLEQQDFRFTAALETIVLSEQFREIRGRDTVTANTTE